MPKSRNAKMYKCQNVEIPNFGFYAAQCFTGVPGSEFVPLGVLFATFIHPYSQNNSI
jgi:hypothetical protein